MEFKNEHHDELQDILNILLGGELNDKGCRKSARLCARTYLMAKDIDFKMVKCDEENNSPSIVDDNNLIVDIYTLEYKYHTIII